MHFAEFYTKNKDTGELMDQCGDRSVYILDGRNSRSTMISDTKMWAAKNNKLATHAKICVGPRFTESHLYVDYFEIKILKDETHS